MKNIEIFSFDENKFDSLINDFVSMNTDENDRNIEEMDLELLFDHNCFDNYSYDMHNDLINL